MQTRENLLLLAAAVLALTNLPAGISLKGIIFSIFALSFFVGGFFAKKDLGRALAIMAISILVISFSGIFSLEKSPPVHKEWPLSFIKYESLALSFEEGKSFLLPGIFSDDLPSYPIGSPSYIVPALLSLALEDAVLSWAVWATIVFSLAAISVFSFSGRGRIGFLASCVWLCLQPHSFFFGGNISSYFAITLSLAGISLLKGASKKGILGNSLEIFIFLALFLTHPGIFCISLAFFAIRSVLLGKTAESLGRIFPLLVLPLVAFFLIVVSTPSFWTDPSQTFKFVGTRQPGNDFTLSRLLGDFAISIPAFILFFVARFLSYMFGGAESPEKMADAISVALVVGLSLFANLLPSNFPFGLVRAAFGAFVLVFFLAVSPEIFSGYFFSGKGSLKTAGFCLALLVVFVSLLSLSAVILREESATERIFPSGPVFLGEPPKAPLLSGKLSDSSMGLFFWVNENPVPFPGRIALKIDGEFSGGYLGALFPFYAKGEYVGSYNLALSAKGVSGWESIEDVWRVERLVSVSYSDASYPKVYSGGEFFFAYDRQSNEPTGQCSFRRVSRTFYSGQCPGSEGAFPFPYWKEIVPVVNGSPRESFENSKGEIGFGLGGDESSFSLGLALESFPKKVHSFLCIVVSLLMPFFAVFFIGKKGAS